MDGNIPRLQAELQQKILESRTIVDLYRPIIDAYIVDFFHLNHWNSLPPSWIRCFSTIPIEHLPALLSFENRNTETTVWPLTVLTLRSLFRRLVHTRSEPKTTEKHPTDPNCVYYKQSSLFHKSVKLKKRHEIEQFATNCSRENNCRTLVDIGSGQGNLARTLAYGFGFRVCCLEQNESFVQAARQKDAELWRRLVKLEPKLQNTTTATPHPVHLHEKVNLDHIDPNAFEQLLRDALNIEKGQHSDALQFGLIGLHPCGDLAPSLLRLFLACHECRFIKLVCCCYMKLSCESSISNGEPKEYGFPLSDFCRRTNLTLSYEAREMACHAIEQYRERLSGDYHELKIHAYRAAIESIIVRLRPDLKHAGLKGGIRATEVSFAEYCQRAVDGLGVTVPESDVHSAATQSRLSRWEEVVKFYTIRLMFAPLIETIVLYDRWLFLLEQGTNARIDVLFDPYLSPRNHVITAYK
ncbi:protein RRNAD1 isoform X1 [Anopheles arabiensis]|uniref:Methyltransferase domain-containing protein n=1 Tax=Anopheles arabiensis TaxID=7173 RepID=A0A182I3M1_ANOAR|nr:protein RRNAD1 isoform X1 [Anopheles arabiensis]